MKKIFRAILKTIKWIFLLIVVLAIISAVYNLFLPKESEIIEHLAENEKAYIAETMNLQQNLGSEVWPGWSNLDIPVIVYNEKYAFLIGYPNPPSGWYKMPKKEYRGVEWEIVETDDFFGKTYYRQALPNPDITPENFTVKVGDRWVTSMQTKEYAAVAFYNGFKSELPPVVNAIFPYKIFWYMLMGKAENYICGMAHESFHAFQGNEVPEKFAECEKVSHLSSDYPWENTQNADGWISEVDLLLEAYHAQSNIEAKQLVEQFLDKRRKRRVDAGLSEEMIQYEQKREWIEGLAKYAELKIGLCAEESKSYSPIAEIMDVPAFENYKNRTSYYNQQIDEVKRTANRSGESRFYYVGMLQAVLLDQLMLDWKSEAFNEGIYLDDLLGNINSENNIDQEIMVDVPESELYVRVRGNTEKPLIINLHGGPGGYSGIDIKLMGPALEDNFLIAYFDQRGCGKSLACSDSSRLHVEQYVEDLDIVIDSLMHRYKKESVNLMGTSWGGMYGFLYMLSHQEKVQSYACIDGKVNSHYQNHSIIDFELKKSQEILDTTSSAPKKAKLEFIISELKRIKTSNFANFHKDVNWMKHEVPAKLGFNAYFVDTSKIISFKDVVDDTALMSLMRYTEEEYAEVGEKAEIVNRAFRNNPDYNNINIESELAKIITPTVVIQGEHDYVVGTEHAQLIFDALSSLSEENKELHILPNTGHCPAIESPDKLSAILNSFFDNHAN